MRKKIYFDEENKVLFFEPKYYLEGFIKEVLNQIKRNDFCVLREINIHIPRGDEELLKLIKENPNKNSFFEIRFCFESSTSYRWSKSRKDAVKIIKERENEEYDRIFIDEYKLLKFKQK